MNLFLILAFLFFLGSVFGWILELLFRRFVSSSNPERKWINPGFCIGPYLPLYGCGLCIMYLICSLDKLNVFDNRCLNIAVLFPAMIICMTAVEYIAGILCLKIMKVRLWDYSSERGNIQGIICPKFSLAWALLGSVYYLFIHPYIIDALNWLSQNLAFSFVIGLFFGVFIIDAIYSAQLITKIKKFANDNDVIVKYEHLKVHIRSIQDKQKQKHHFLFPLHSEHPLDEYLNDIRTSLEQHIKRKK